MSGLSTYCAAMVSYCTGLWNDFAFRSLYGLKSINKIIKF